MDGDASKLIRLLDAWSPRRVVVAGDFMLDRHIYGNADRLSPDAPVPVLSIVREEEKPGGAANVCLDLQALRCQSVVLGVVGDDAWGGVLRERLTVAGCDDAGLIVAEGRPTTVKHNFVGLAQHRHPQKMFRVDQETRRPLRDETARRLLDAAGPLLDAADVLCLEDYDKGVLTPDVCRELIRMARERGVPVLVDPAAIRNYGKYRGATCITPNRTEAQLATGMMLNEGGGEGGHEGGHEGRRERDMAATEAVAQRLLDDLALDAVVLTLDRQGALLARRGEPSELVPTVARQVYDVTGAGDMVLATLAAALPNGATWPEAVRLANVAAGLEVERFGVVPIELDELLLAVLRLEHASLGKLRRLDALLRELAAHRSEGGAGKKGRPRVVFTNGCFDILHAGHVSYLREARRRGDLLVVGVNTDASIRRLKGEARPVNTQDDRLLVLSELESVDYLVLFDDDTPRTLIEAIRPDVLAKGADYRKEQVVGGEFVESYGGRVELIDLVEGRSTTNIIERVRSTQR